MASCTSTQSPAVGKLSSKQGVMALPSSSHTHASSTSSAQCPPWDFLRRLPSPLPFPPSPCVQRVDGTRYLMNWALTSQHNPPSPTHCGQQRASGVDVERNYCSGRATVNQSQLISSSCIAFLISAIDGTYCCSGLVFSKCQYFTCN